MDGQTDLVELSTIHYATRNLHGCTRFPGFSFSEKESKDRTTLDDSAKLPELQVLDFDVQAQPAADDGEERSQGVVNGVVSVARLFSIRWAVAQILPG